MRNSNVKFQCTSRILKHLPYDVLLKENASKFMKNPNIHFDAFKMRSAIFMTFIANTHVCLLKDKRT